MTTIESFRKLYKQGKFCDLTLVERAYRETREYRVHRPIMYISSPYFKAQFDGNFIDSETNKITIETDSTETGLLQVVIDAVYSKSGNQELLYHQFVKETVANTDTPEAATKIMNLYLLCSYLMLDEHLRYLCEAITQRLPMKHLTVWWKKRNANGKTVPDDIETLVQEYLYSQIKYLDSMGTAFISLPALTAMWPEDADQDPFARVFGELLQNVDEASKAKATSGDNDPNEWMTSKSEDSEEDVTTLPEADDHPSLVWYDATKKQWLDIESSYIFQQNDRTRAWYVSGYFDSGAQRMRPLTEDQKTDVLQRGWNTGNRRDTYTYTLEPDHHYTDDEEEDE